MSSNFPLFTDAIDTYMGIWNHTQSPDLLPTVIDEGFTACWPLCDSIEGGDAFRKVQKSWHTSFNPFNIEWATLDGPRSNQCTIIFKLRAVFSKDFKGIKAHGKQVEVNGSTVFTFTPEGQILHDLTMFDGDDLLKQCNGSKLTPQF